MFGYWAAVMKDELKGYRRPIMQMQFIRVGVREFCESLDGRGETCVLRIVQLCESRDYRVIEFIRGEPSEI